ncbi:MAG: hypothetical protein EOP84_21340, partial [Verrucomicrobiaceae bacterium]
MDQPPLRVIAENASFSNFTLAHSATYCNSVIRKLFLLLQPALLAAVLLGAVGCANGPSSSGDVPAASIPPVVRQNDDNTIGVGDELELFVKEDAVFNGTYRVRERGDIIIPDLGRIPVAGLNVESAERRVEGYIEKGQIKEATVILDRTSNPSNKPTGAGSRQLLVYMTGAVAKAGQHMLTLPEGRSLGVYEAIMISGGMSRFADEQKVYV